MLKAIFEPILLGRKTDQHARRFAMARDNDLLCLRFVKIARQVGLNFRDRNFLHFGVPNRGSHAFCLRLAHAARPGSGWPGIRSYGCFQPGSALMRSSQAAMFLCCAAMSKPNSS